MEMNSDKRIFLIDGMSLVFRAYHAMFRMNLTNTKGEPSGALFGFVNLITSFLEREKPKNVAVVFDVKAPTFRHKMFPQYKANRAAFPEELIPQVPKIKQFLDLIGIPQFEKSGFEADDLIGTIAKGMAKEGYKVFCLTNDKDYFQFVDENIKLIRPQSKGEYDIVDIEAVHNKFGVLPKQVIDVLALWGDASDNIPGVKGVGEKTAIPLIAKYGNLENLYEHLDEIERKSVREKLEKDKKNAFLSKELVTIITDVDIEYSIEKLIQKTPKYLELDDFLQIENMRQAKAKWKAKHKIADGKSSNDENILDIGDGYKKLFDEKSDYRLINTKEDLLKTLDYLKQQTEISFDLETSSLDIYSCEIVGIAFSAEKYKAFYIATSEEDVSSVTDLFTQKETFKTLDIHYVLELLKGVLEEKNINKIAQNAKFDSSILRRYGIEVKPIVFDTMLASYIINPDNKHNMDDMARRLLEYSPVSIKTIIGEKKKDQKSMKDINPEQISDYACEDADITYQLKQVLVEKLKSEKLEKLANEIEFPLLNVLMNIENNGVMIDKKALVALSIKLATTLTDLTKKIFDESGIEFNIDSPKQLGHILFEKMGIPPLKKTKTGFSTDVTVLTEIALTHKIAEYLLEYRTIQKLKSTYIDTLPKLVNKKTGRLHTTFNQTIASTGRLTSNNPNLQNIPIRTDLGKEIRKAFIAKDKEHIIFAADYSQVELRIMAYMCGDEKMIESFKNGEDIHTSTAAILFDKEIEEVDKDERRTAKTVNFGIMYGLGSFGLSQRLEISRKRAKEIIDNYLDKYEKIQTYMDITIESVRDKTYAETIMKRRRYFNDIHNSNANIRRGAERGAINMPIQGTAADMMKIAMIDIDNEMTKRKMKSKMILQVHDELVFDTFKPELEELQKLVIEKMTNAMPLGDVPIVVDSGFGQNWFEAH